MLRVRVLLRLLAVATAGALVAAPSAAAVSSPTVYVGVGAGDGPGSAAAALSAFEAGVGGVDNGDQPGPVTGGYRQTSLVGVGTSSWTSPTVTANGFIDPGSLGLLDTGYLDPFGVSASTPGSAIATSTDGLREFDSSYPVLFQAVGSSTLFAPVGSTETDLRFVVPIPPPGPPPFFLPSSPVASPPTGNRDAAVPGAQATISGFGATFVNVEVANSSSIQFLRADGSSIATDDVPSGAPGGPEFLGVLFNGAPVASVKITTGNTPLGSDDTASTGSGANIVALEDMILSEPLYGASLTITSASMPNASTAVVSGVASDPLGISSVVVNGVTASLAHEGTWTATIPFNGGDANISVTDTRGLTTTGYAIPAPFAPTSVPEQTTATPTTSAARAPRPPCTLTAGKRSVTVRRSMDGTAPPRTAHVTVRLRAACTQHGVASLRASLRALQPHGHAHGNASRTLVLRKVAVTPGRTTIVPVELPRRFVVLLSQGARIDGHATLTLASTTTKTLRIATIRAPRFIRHVVRNDTRP